MPRLASCCLANANEMKTLPYPILPVDGVNVVDVVVPFASVVVREIAVPLRKPVTNASELAVEPANPLKSELILSETTVAPRVDVSESVCLAWVVSVVSLLSAANVAVAPIVNAFVNINVYAIAAICLFIFHLH